MTDSSLPSDRSEAGGQGAAGELSLSDLDHCAEQIFNYAKDTLGLQPAHAIYALASALGAAMGNTTSTAGDEECLGAVCDGIKLARDHARQSLNTSATPDNPDAETSQ